MARDRIDFIYSPDYLDWQLGEGHPTDPQRAVRALKMLRALDVPHDVVAPRMAERAELGLVHTTGYLDDVLIRGTSGEWAGSQPVLAQTARLMAGGTMVGAERIMAGESLVAFNPQGAKHHAHSDHSSGFCVFNDMAMAAQKFIGLMGWRVLYIDLDVHHGDGVEALLRDEPNAMTFSMHGDGFPGTGTSDDVDHHAYNTMFRQGTGDQHWVDDLWRFLRYEATPFMPHVVMLACGADSHRTDPLGGLQITVDGYAQAADLVWEFADAFTDGRVLIGGAGGYQPEFWTPMIWATVAQRFSVGVAERAKPVYATP